jgi:hypothetical protein
MAFKMKKNSPLKIGQCGIPGYPSCEEELKNMTAKAGKKYKGIKSYLNSIKLSDTRDMKKLPNGASFMTYSQVADAVKAETKRRIKNLTSDPGYIALTKNSAARPVTNRITQYIKSAESARGKRAVEYIIPSKKETRGLLNIGRKYANSKDLKKDVSFADNAKALFYGAKILNKYENLAKIAKKKGLN